MQNTVNDEKSKKIERSVAVWNNILKASLNLPGARINRADFLEKHLSKYCEKDKVTLAIENTPAIAKIEKKIINHISDTSINWHTAQVTALSFAAGLPGGWWMAGTIPADLTQFYYNVIQLLQKLAYLYGWPELFSDNENELDDETLLKFTLFIGVMFGSREATMIITELSKRLSQQIIKRLPQKALTKYGIYNMTKQIARWIGIKVTKETFSKGLAKIIPVIGGFISGTVSFLAFKPMGKKLKKHLKSLPLAELDLKTKN
jgi:hypothetical protein